ncbi:hypothetical protein PENTCL1PPCAC_23452 [Pristionchus entomophagus]|uniref:Myotubularin phosphatase domain-containing protein n=1 Tax=Pristionchus entomophagus TaxID=358040 RepID=A0AAV5U3T4_9BILA|nr:hypothetical protein PENTCL1PPCAC_23452 [Pristionchus entomophagus]
MNSTSFRSFVDRTPSAVGDLRIPTLLPDEHISVRCENCRCRLQMGKTFDATLVSTNYRLLVVKAVEQQTDVPRRMRVHDERVSIPLCAIYSLRYADAAKGAEGNGLGGALSPFRANLRRSRKGGGEKGEKSTERELKQFKPLVTSLSSMEIISCLKVYLKDMRLLFIDLRNAASASNLANHLLHFSRPPRADRLSVVGEGGGERGRKVPFTDRLSWEDEVRRLTPKERQSMWRVVDLRAETIHADASSYPPTVVACAGLSVPDVREGTHSWEGGRFPVWVFSWKGTVLMRSGLPISSASAAITQRKFEDRIAGTHDSQAVPHVIRLDGQELALDKIGAAFEKLHKICAVDNSARAHRYGKVWPTRVAETGWLQTVTSVLHAAAETVARLVDHEESVLLQEGEGRDVSAVVSSLVQVCLDKQSRRMEGLQRIVEKEWISLGHPFSRRLLSVEGAPFCPVFLLFLDSLSQLIEMYPTQFEYSSSALVALWDLVLTGSVGSVSCEDATEMAQLGRTSSAFLLDAHYKEPVTLLFGSVQYAAASLVTRTGRSVPLLADIIRPPTCTANVKLWNECYLRWQPDALVKGGGPLLSAWALDRLMEKRQTEMGVKWKMTIGTIDEDMISSCFPYSSARSNEDQVVGHSERPSIGSIASLATLQISRETDYDDYGGPTPLSTPTVTIQTPTVPTVRYHSGSVTVSGEGANSVLLTPRHHSGSVTVSSEAAATVPLTPQSSIDGRPTSIPVRQAPPVPPKTFSRSYV